jgi:DNA-binding IclR family transcriptional regulator
MRREGVMRKSRGRPPWQMTARRRQVLEAFAELAAAGERVRLAELARRCGLYDYREARRIVRDLARMGAI